MKLLGLNTLVETVADMASYTSQLPSAEQVNKMVEEIAELKKFQRDLATAQEGLSAKVDEVTEKVDEIEIPDMDDYVAHSDLDDNIESYLNNNDYATQSYVDDEIESKVSDAIDDADIESKIETAIEDLDIEEKVRDLFNDASPAPMSEDAIKEEIQKAIAEVFSKVYDTLKRK